MNWIQLIRLFRTIYAGNPPNIAFIQKMGLLAVKIGQTYAQRADFLSIHSCRELAKLYRQTDPAPPDDVDSLIKNIGIPAWEESFKELESTPFASASVGQVHRGQLKTGETVVAKLVKQPFHASFDRDVRSVRRLLKLAVLCYPKLARVADPLGTLASIEATTLAELDLTKEARGQEKLRTIYREHRSEYNLAKLKFPKIHAQLSNQNVLVSEFIKAPTFDELLESQSLSYQSLLDLFEIHGFFLFCVGTFHGDIHPGNIMLQGEDIVFLDCGAISSVPQNMRVGVFRFFDAIVRAQFDEAARALESMSRHPLASRVRETFTQEFRDLYSGFLGKSVAELSLTKQMMQTIRLAVDHSMDFETGMYPIIKSLMYLDGMALRCAPDTDLMADLKPFLDRFRPFVTPTASSPAPTGTLVSTY